MKATDNEGQLLVLIPSINLLYINNMQVLRKLTADAAKFLNDKVEKAVITVPAYFNDSQRQVSRQCRCGAL
jgi:hypothetical protein